MAERKDPLFPPTHTRTPPSPHSFTEEPDLHEQLQLHLEKFLPGLLQSMTLSPYSREVLDLDNEDHDKPDNATDVKPHIHKSRVTGATTKVPSLAARMGMTADDIAAANGGVVDEEDEEGYEKEEEDEDDEENSEWTVRVASARALESAAETFEAALLDILLPHVTQMLSSGDWYQREAAIFALGNVALGECAERCKWLRWLESAIRKYNRHKLTHPLAVL